MTTKNDFLVTSNVFVKNNVFNIENKNNKNPMQIAAALKLYSGRPLVDRQEKVLTELYLRIKKFFPDHLAWILIGNGGEVPDNRIVRYYRLWKALEKSEVYLPKGDRTQEYIIENNGKIQIFGGIRLKHPKFQEILNFFSTHTAAYIILTDSEDSVRALLSSGFSLDSRKFSISILRQVEKTTMFALARLGAFDDREGGGVAMARPALIEKCFCVGSG